MSRAAYEAYFRQSAPAGALFGVDISWYQGASGDYVDRGVASGYWDDFGSWADFICVRTSYGGSGDDGAQALHFQIAAERNYDGALGCYHFVHAGPGVAANFDNFMRRSEPFVDQTQYDMLDYEAAPNAGAAAIDELCDRTEQKRQRPTLPYGGKGYLDDAGTITCPANRLWAAHYPARSADAWSPTSSWSSNGAPLMPDQYGNVLPGVWQWQSMTPQHGSLDLDISTTPDAFGIGDTVDMLQADERLWLQTLYAIFMDDNGRWGRLWNGAAASEGMVPVLARVAAVTERFNTDAYAHSTGHDPNNPDNSLNIFDELRAAMKAPPGAVLPPVDIDKLAAALAPKLDVAGTVARTLATALAALLKAASGGVGSTS